MLLLLLVILILLWVAGYVRIPYIPNAPLFVLLGHQITLWDVLIFLLILWIISILPRPFRIIASIIFILWIISLFGFSLFVPLGGWFLLALIVLLIISLVF